MGKGGSEAMFNKANKGVFIFGARVPYIAVRGGVCLYVCHGK